NCRRGCLCPRPSGGGAGPAEETLPDRRGQGAGGGLRADPQGDAAAAGHHPRRDGERRHLQCRSRADEAGGQAEVLRRPVHRPVRQMSVAATGAPTIMTWLPRSIVLVALGFGLAPAHAQPVALEDVTVAVPNFTFTLTPTLVADELGLWERNGLRFKMI